MLGTLPTSEFHLKWCAQVVASSLHWEKQEDGRMRFWGEIIISGETRPRYLRVVMLEDGETIHINPGD